jgi:DNA-directed RNA polymerase specialized sigma24 family protein
VPDARRVCFAQGERMSDPQSPEAGCFPTTQWTQILAPIQRGESDSAWAALNEFCQCYRPAVCQFFRRHGCDPDQAQELTQEFFLKRILKPWDDRASFLHTAERSRGRFRSFLCHVLWRFLQDEWKSRNAAGRTASHIPLEELMHADAAADGEAFKKFGSAFDRVFAQQLLHRAAERSNHSRHLLAHFRREISQEQAARELGLSENAFKQAYDRFKKRLALDLAAEAAKIAGPDENDIRAEIRYLMSLFGG